jgi:hypothetical protein
MIRRVSQRRRALTFAEQAARGDRKTVSGRALPVGLGQKQNVPARPLSPRRGTPKTEALVSIGVYLEVTLMNGQNYSIPVEEGHSLEQELELFLKREGRYATGWVPLMKAGRALFVRYEQIVLVSPSG